jgi:hypothetical protein
MNSLDLVCAQLSAASYVERVAAANRIKPVVGATPLPGALGYRVEGGLSGFEASAYEYEGKIILAYTGTDPSQLADMGTNATLALGGVHPQLKQAVEFYQAIKNRRAPTKRPPRLAPRRPEEPRRPAAALTPGSLPSRQDTQRTLPAFHALSSVS